MPPLMNMPAYRIDNTELQTEPVVNALMQNRAYGLQQERMGLERERTGMDRERLNMTRQQHDEERQAREVQRIGKEAEAIHGLQGPQRQAVWQRWTSSNPQVAQHMAKFGIDPNDHMMGPEFLAREASGYDPMKRKIQEMEMRKNEAQTGLYNAQAEHARAQATGEAGVKYGLNPVPYQKPDGSIGYMVPSTRGESKELGIPGGGAAMPKVNNVQTPTEVVGRDQFGREVYREKKDIVGKEADEEVGKARGKATVDLPRIAANAELALKTIEQLRTHPGKPYAIGALGVIPGIPGTQQKGFIELNEQAKGQAFLEAFNSLRGGGQITEAEGAKATQALARLNRSQNQADYDKALSDYEEVINKGLARARAAARPINDAQQPTAPTGGKAAPGAYRWTPEGGLQPLGGDR